MKSRSAILRGIGIFEIELTPEKQKEYEKINDAYGREFDKRYEKRMKQRDARSEAELRHFIIN